MSVYTTELRYIVDDFLTQSDVDIDAYSINEKIEMAQSLIFDNDYPIWDENHRIELNCKIIQSFYMREIAYETVALWKHYFNTKMRVIMPKYVNFYNAQAEFLKDPYGYDKVRGLNRDRLENDTFAQTDKYGETDKYTETDKKVFTDTAETDTNEVYSGTQDETLKNSQTPMGGINMTNVTSGAYLTTVDINSRENQYTDDTTQKYQDDNTTNTTVSSEKDIDSEKNTGSTDENTQNTVENEHTLGYNDNRINLYADLVETYTNIDQMIIDELATEFMGVF